jgi:hypothetical protein
LCGSTLNNHWLRFDSGRLVCVVELVKGLGAKAMRIRLCRLKAA